MADSHYRWWLDYWAGTRGADWPDESDGRADLPAIYRHQARVLDWLTEGRSVHRVLELGCGDGRLYDSLDRPWQEYWGVDFRVAEIEAFRTRHPELRLYDADAATFRVDQRFDLIFSVAMIQYFDLDMLRLHLENAHAMLADDGVLVLADFAWKSHQLQSLLVASGSVVRSHSMSELKERLRDIAQSRHMRAYSRSQLTAFAADAGFDIEFFGSFIIPGYLTARMTKAGASRHCPPRAPARIHIA